MNWREKIYNYCERGSDPALWAEPVNALTNIAFFVAAVAAAWRLAAKGNKNGSALAPLLIALVGAIGAGSFAFHLYATRWAQLADVGAITFFNLAYLGFALRGLLGLGWAATLAGVAGFGAVSVYVSTITCGGAACLNGSLGYVPGIAALFILGAAARQRERRASSLLFCAGGILLVSVALRSIDIALCDMVAVAGHRLGTHSGWHLLNALLVYLLLRIAVDHTASPRPGSTAADDATIATGPASSHKGT